MCLHKLSKCILCFGHHWVQGNLWNTDQGLEPNTAEKLIRSIFKHRLRDYSKYYDMCIYLSISIISTPSGPALSQKQLCEDLKENCWSICKAVRALYLQKTDVEEHTAFPFNCTQPVPIRVRGLFSAVSFQVHWQQWGLNSDLLSPVIRSGPDRCSLTDKRAVGRRAPFHQPSHSNVHADVCVTEKR